MHYAHYRRKKHFVGSGVVEPGCRTVIGERLKQSGMHWSVGFANAIITLLCCILSGRFEDFGLLALLSLHFYLVHPDSLVIYLEPPTLAFAGKQIFRIELNG